MLKINKILSKNIKYFLPLRGAFPHVIARKQSDRSNLNPSGFSLVELMVAVAILAMVIFGIFLAFSTAFQGMADARDRTVATNYAQEEMENIKNMDFEYITSIPLEQIGLTKYSREVNVETNIEGSPNLKRATTRVFWQKRSGENTNVETSMLINKIEFLPGEATKLLLYVMPYNIIYPQGDFVDLTAVVKDASGNTITDWDSNITFNILGVTPGDIECYLGETSGVTSITLSPENGIATTKLHSESPGTLEADEVGNILVEAVTDVVGADSVNIKVTWGAVKIDLISTDESIKINENTTITARILNANDNIVTQAEAELIFNVYGEGTLSEPLTLTTTEGEAQITLYASSTPGIATVTASAENLLSDSLPIFITGLPYFIYVSLNPNYIYLDQSSEVTATLKDVNGVTVNAESNVTINFSLSTGSVAQGNFTPDSITIPLGSSTGSTNFYPTIIGSGTVRAADAGGSLITGEAAIYVADLLVADHIEVSASPASIKAGGDNSSTITAVIKSADGARAYNYSEPVTFTTDKGSFSAIDSGITEITLITADDNYQDGVVSVELYSDSDDTSGVASIAVTSGTLTQANMEVAFYVEADHITLNAFPDTINLFGVPSDTCKITATINDNFGNIVPIYVGNVIFSIVDGGNFGQFTTVGSAIVTVNGGQASVDLRAKCLPGNVVVHAVSTFGETQISSGLNDENITVTDGSERSIELVIGSISQPTNKKGVGFDVNNIGVELKIYNLQATWGSSAKITEIKIDDITVYSGSVSDGDIVDITPTDLSSGVHEIYFTYSSAVDNTGFEIILNAEPDCELLETIIFST